MSTPTVEEIIDEIKGMCTLDGLDVEAILSNGTLLSDWLRTAITTLIAEKEKEASKAYDMGRKDGLSEEYKDGYFHGHLAGVKEKEEAVATAREEGVKAERERVVEWWSEHSRKE